MVVAEPRPAHLGAAGSDGALFISKLLLDEWNKLISEFLWMMDGSAALHCVTSQYSWAR